MSDPVSEPTERSLQKGTPEYNHAAYLRKNARTDRRCVDCGASVVYNATRCQLCKARYVADTRKFRSDGWTRERAITAIQAWARSHGGESPSTAERDAKGSDLPKKQTCVRLFGSWNAAIVAAGLEPRAQGQNRRSTPSGRKTGPRVGNRQMVTAGRKGAAVVYQGTATARDHKVP
jgi:hypothetical protein